jgi:hypothetical protein
MASILLITVTFALINAVLWVVEYVQHDGTRRVRRQAPPRSHAPDLFDPHYGSTRQA